MENINRISFFNLGNTFVNSEGNDYYEIINPGIAVMLGNDNNFILYYSEGSVSKIETMSAIEEWYEAVATYFIEKYNLETKIEFLSGLLACADNEDEDGLYDHMQETGGQVMFDSPNNEIDPNIGLFIVKQHGDAQTLGDASMKTEGSKLHINENVIDLKELSVGYFDNYQEPLLIYAI